MRKGGEPYSGLIKQRTADKTRDGMYGICLSAMTHRRGKGIECYFGNFFRVIVYRGLCVLYMTKDFSLRINAFHCKAHYIGIIFIVQVNEVL